MFYYLGDVGGVCTTSRECPFTVVVQQFRVPTAPSCSVPGLASSGRVSVRSGRWTSVPQFLCAPGLARIPPRFLPRPLLPSRDPRRRPLLASPWTRGGGLVGCSVGCASIWGGRLGGERLCLPGPPRGSSVDLGLLVIPAPLPSPFMA